MKRFLSIFLFLLLTLTMCPGVLAEADVLSGAVELTVPEEEAALPGFADEGDTYADFVGEVAGGEFFPGKDGFSYKLNADGTGMIFQGYYETIQDYRKKMPYTRLEIPAEYNGYPVVGIEYMAFAYQSNLEYVKLPDTIKTIEHSAFYDCSALKEVVFPDSVQTIGRSLFSGCTALESVKLPKKLERIETFMFSGCSSLKRIEIPDSVTTIGRYAFSSCAMESLRLPAGLTAIEEGTFNNCAKLKSIDVPKGVTTIGLGAFKGCASLESVGLHAGLVEIGNNAFENCAALEKIDLPEGLKTVGRAAFKACDALKELTIPGTVSELGEFEGNSLEKVTLAPGIKSVGAYVFLFANSLKDMYIPASVKEIGDFMFPPEIAGQLVIHGEKGSYAEAYAKANGVTFDDGTIDLSGADVTVKAQVYTGEALTTDVTVKLGKKTLTKGTDYTVKYSDNIKVGKATVKIKGKGKYSGTVKKTFKINPKAVTKLALKAGSKKLTVTWKKVSGASGYEIQYGTKKDFSNAKKAKVKKTEVKTTLKKLNAKKKYYVRIRAYKTVSGKKYYSKWDNGSKKTK